MSIEKAIAITGATNSKRWLGHEPGDLIITGSEWECGVIKYEIQPEPLIRCSHLIPSLQLRHNDGIYFIMSAFRDGVCFNEVLP